MKFRKSVIAAVMGTLMIASSPLAAVAINASTSGAYAYTTTAKKFAAKDTAADSLWAEARINRGANYNTTYILRNKNGYNTTKYSGTGYGYALGNVSRIMACTRNNNPLDSGSCSSWRY